MPLPPFRWDRFWFPAGSQVSLIDGYLPDPEGWMGPHLDAAGVSLSALVDIPCLILLGLPGMGKTSEMEASADAARQANALVDVVSLARLSGPAELASRLLGSERHSAWRRGSTVWNIYLDGLDEALAQLSQIEAAILLLARQLAADEPQLKNLRLRISCRSAEWPQAFETELRGIWDAEQVKVYELGHLREKDVKIAAAELFPSVSQQDQFISYVREHEGQPLASRPITLNMLLNVFKDEGTLPQRQVELYRKGLLASIEEANETRRSNRATWWLDTRSKLIVAARIAAASVFSNSFEIWTGHQSQVAPKRAVIVSEISGGHEPALGSSFRVGEAELRETLLCSLFVPLRSSLFGWSHQTFAEFLAAYYIVEHGLNAEEAMRLFRGAGEENGQIPPQLTEVAAWLASMQPDFFRALIITEPAILLRSDVAAASPEDRSALVGELLRRIDNGELHDFQHGFRFRYERLNHPQLSEQLRAYITDKTKNRVVRRVAIDIAEANNLTKLAGLLVDVALDVADDIHIRSQAAHAVSTSSEVDARERLRSLLESDQPEDIYDDLKGYALRALWPGQLSVSELLNALTLPKKDNYFGSYSLFLSELQLPALGEADAISVLEWCRNALQEDLKYTSFEKLIPRFLARVFEASGNSAVKDRLSAFLLTAVRNRTYWSYEEDFRRSFSETVLVDAHQHLRRSLVLSILLRAVASQDRDWILLLGRPDPLIANSDLRWLVGLLGSETLTAIKQHLVELIVSQTFGQDLGEVSFVWDAASTSRELFDALELAYSVDLSSSAAKWQREDFERKKKLSQEQQRPVDAVAQLERQLEKIEVENSFDWWRLNLMLFVGPSGRPDPSSEFQSDITKSRGWGLLSETEHRRVISAARRYLVENIVYSRAWLGTNTFHRPAAAGYRALRLLFVEDHAEFSRLSHGVWRKWATSILGVSFNEDAGDHEARERIVRECYGRAPRQVLAVIRRLILKAKSEFDVRNVLNWFASSSDEKLNALLWAIFSEIRENDFRAKPIISFLVRERYAPAVQRTIDLFAQPSSEFLDQTFGKEEFVLAAAALVQTEPTLVWPYFCDLRHRNDGLAIEILKSFADSSAFIEHLSEPQLSDLFVWLYRSVPAPIDEDGARYIGFEDHAERLRSAIIRNLISRGTKASVAAVEEIASNVPEAEWLRWQVVDARHELAAKSWKQLDAAEIIAVIASYRPVLPLRSTKETIELAAVPQLDADAGSMETAATWAETAPATVLLPDTAIVAGAGTVKRRRIMAVATEWSSGHGGLSTLNRELCIALADVGHDVVCLVIEPTQREIDEAKVAKVRLIGCPFDPAIRDVARLLLFHPSQIPNFTPEIVVGHDHITGSAAQNIAHRHYQVPNVHFVHTLPEEIEMYKSRSDNPDNPDNPFLRGDEKAEVQYRQCLAAQLVVGVGPRIYREMSTKIVPNSNIPVVVMRPGLNRRLLNYEADLATPRSPHCLFLARLEDGDLKGAGLACEMICSLNTDWEWQSTRPRLILRGLDPAPEKFAKEIERIGGFSAAIPYLIGRRYTSDADVIAADIRSASAMIMPSKREGFGLTALEGISAGIPTVVSSESGLAALLLEADVLAAIGKPAADACVAAVDGDPLGIRKDWASRVQAILSDPGIAFSRAKKMRAALLSILSWERAAERLSGDIETMLQGGSAATTSVR